MKKLLFSFIPVIVAAGVLLAALFLFSGCYTLKQGTTMLGYLGRAVPLEELAKKGDEERAFAEQVEDIRRFAIDELGLAESKNYTRYVELDRNYLAAVVSASARDSFTTHEWWFPVVGKVPYKGFFNAADARKEAEKLQKKDLDVWVRGVDAFSTLGWFRDPLYSYMKNYTTRELADLIIHEQLHATIYLKSHSQFNEELAEFVGSEGARLYMERIGGPEPPAGPSAPNGETADNPAESRADNAAYIAFLQNLIAELDGVYKSGISREEKLSRKAEIIAAAKTRFTETYDHHFKTENYRGFSDLQVNNAYLDLYRLYHGAGEESYFKTLYERFRGELRASHSVGAPGLDLKAFIEAAKTLKGKNDPREELESALGLK
jgi:predicted aminopeptidase